MTAKFSRLRMRDLVLFVVVAGVVAVAALFAAREAGVGGGAEAQGEQLILTVTPEASYCVTERAQESWGIGSGGARLSSGWVVAADLALQWSVTGGALPYTLEIDGESEDASGERFSGAIGRASVPCVDSSVSWRWGKYSGGAVRLYGSDPQVNSGWTTVRAEVTDANGDKAEATARFYIVLDGPDYYPALLKRGETYRIFGHLFTIPTEYDMQVGARATGSSGPGYQSFIIAGTDPSVSILFEIDNFTEFSRKVPAQSDGATGTSDNSTTQQRNFNSALDSFADSVDQPPSQ